MLSKVKNVDLVGDVYAAEDINIPGNTDPMKGRVYLSTLEKEREKKKEAETKTIPQKILETINNFIEEIKPDDIVRAIPKDQKPEFSQTVRKVLIDANVTPTPSPEVLGIKDTATIDPEKIAARNPNFYKYTISDDVHSAIQKAANKYNISPEIMYDIGIQESGLNPTSKNAGSTAEGLFQYLDKTWNWLKTKKVIPQDAKKSDPRWNAEATAWALSQGYLSWWDESKTKEDGSGWGEYYTSDELKKYDLRIGK